MTDKIRAKIDELEGRIETLEDQLDESASDAVENDLLDQYDTYVIAETIESAHPRYLMKLYEESGVRDETKQKRRTKRLKRLAEEGKL